MLWVTVREKMRDKERMEALLRQSSVDWTIVRPPRLGNGSLTRHYRTGIDLRLPITAHISCADVADFMLAQLESTRYNHQALAIVAQRRASR